MIRPSCSTIHNTGIIIAKEQQRARRFSGYFLDKDIVATPMHAKIISPIKDAQDSVIASGLVSGSGQKAFFEWAKSIGLTAGFWIRTKFNKWYKSAKRIRRTIKDKIWMGVERINSWKMMHARANKIWEDRLASFKTNQQAKIRESVHNEPTHTNKFAHHKV